MSANIVGLAPALINGATYVALDKIQDKLQKKPFEFRLMDFGEMFIFVLSDALGVYLTPLLPSLPKGKLMMIVREAIPVELLLLLWRFVIKRPLSFKSVLIDLLKVTIALGLGQALQDWIASQPVLSQ